MKYGLICLSIYGREWALGNLEKFSHLLKSLSFPKKGHKQNNIAAGF
jgi:hypothetical protein